MKTITTLFALLLCSAAFCQVTLDDKDFKNLIAISELYSSNNNARGKEFDKSLADLKTAKLAHIVEVLTILDTENKAILTPKYLNRPTDEELQLWYVINKIQDNLQKDNENPRPNQDVAKEVLSGKIDTRWLVDNYYSHLYGGIASLFNDANLSKINIDTEKYGLKNTTEKAIFFLCITRPLIQRFQVLAHLKNADKLVEFAKKMPKFNNKEYYTYTDFNYEDFDYEGYKKIESYTKSHLEQYYGYLLSHFNALADKGMLKEAKSLYFESILFKPEYFKYSTFESSLQELYNNSKK